MLDSGLNFGSSIYSQFCRAFNELTSMFAVFHSLSFPCTPFCTFICNAVGFESANYISQIPLLANFQVGSAMEGTGGHGKQEERGRNTLLPHTIFKKLLFIYLAAQGLSCTLGSFSLSCGTWDLVHSPGITLRPPALEARSLSHRTTRKVPLHLLLDSCDCGSFWRSQHHSQATFSEVLATQRHLGHPATRGMMALQQPSS